MPVALALLVLAHVAPLASDAIDYGSVEELKGVTKVYVDAGRDLDLRNVFKQVLEKTTGLTVVERPEDAEHWIMFQWTDSRPFWARTVIVRNTDGRRRLLFTHRGSEAQLNELAEDSAKAVAKIYQKVNGVVP